MINTANLCKFTGRMVKDVQTQMVGQGQNQYPKVLFSLAVARPLTKEQKQAKSNGQDVTDTDFVNFVATGSQANTIAQYFSKGKPMEVLASYQSYKKVDNNGNSTYGHIFKVENIGFVPGDSSNNNGGNNGNTNTNNNAGNRNGGGNYNNNNNGNYNNGGGNNYNNNNGGNRNTQQNANANNDFFPIDDMETPF